VIIAAAKVGGILANSKNSYEFLLENLKIQNGIIEASQKTGVKNLVFLGSSCIYPRNATQPISEKSLLTGWLEETNQGYAVAKIAGVVMCEAIRKQFSQNYVSLMPTNLYGINDNFDYESSHVPAALMRRIHEAKIHNLDEVKIWGTGYALREFMSVEDLADACWYFLNSDQSESIINIGTGIEITIRDFALLLGNIIGYRGDFTFDESMPQGTPRKVLDVSLANSLGWKHKINLEDGLTSTYEWFELAFKKGDIRGL